jgi:myo-inositol-1-phosphate synthase
MYSHIGGYHVGDVEFVAAFDVDENKLGRDLSDAIFTPPTAAVAHVAVAMQRVAVEPGPLLDGLGTYLQTVIAAHPSTLSVTEEDVTARLAHSAADVMVCFLPTGATRAVQTYARAAARAGVAFVNATPEPVAIDPHLVAMFESARAVLLGDDLRSHLGATTLHTALIELFRSRGLEITGTYQLNIGGNTDFLNLSEPGRAASKIESKRRALSSAGIDGSEVLAGPNGYSKSLGDSKTCHLRVQARGILDSPLSVELRLEVEDSPNAAGVVVNAVRVAKIARDRGLAGVVHAVCPFLFKSPPCGAAESKALRLFQDFVRRADTGVAPAGAGEGVSEAVGGC